MKGISLFSNIGVAEAYLEKVGIDIVVALDISPSMLARDFEPNRVEAAKDVAMQFIAGRSYDNIGLVVFASVSFAENFDNPANMITPFKHPLYTVSVLYLGAVSSVAAFLLLNYANTHLPVSKTTVFSNITTLVSVAAGIVFLDEKLSVVTVISAIMIIAGVWGVQLTNKY